MTPAEDVFIRVSFSLVTIVGLVGNTLVCLVILLNKPMRTPMNYLLVNLAISDSTLLIFFTPLFIFKGTFTHPTGVPGDVMCTFITGGTFAWSGGYTSAFFLVAIAVERFFAIARPSEIQRRITKQKLKIVIVVCWVLALGWNSVGFAYQRYNDDAGFCMEQWPHDVSARVYSTLCLIVVGLVPVGAMFFLYSKVIYHLWIKPKRSPSFTGFTQIAMIKNRKKVTKIVLTVSIVYTLCWIPELCVYTTSAYSPALVKGNIAYPVSVAMVTVNSAINPVIYCFHSDRFRRHLKALICRGRLGSISLGDAVVTQEERVDKNDLRFVNLRRAGNDTSTTQRSVVESLNSLEQGFTATINPESRVAKENC